MPVDEATFARARKLDRPAVEALLAATYPAVHRIAHALAGREDVGRGTVNFVMTHAPRHLPAWRDVDAAERWFYHHTVLTARRAQRHQPDAKQDLLLRGTPAAAADPAYAAFIRGLRTLPVQQREAFILHHGERLNERFLAIAMDCSTRAAVQHLASASETLSALAGPAFDTMTQHLAQAHTALTPREETFLPSLRGVVARSLWPRRIRRVAWLAAITCLVIAAVYLAWRFRHLLGH